MHVERTVVSGDTSFGRCACNRTIIGEINGSEALNPIMCLRGQKLERTGHRADYDVNLEIQSMFDTRWEFCLAIMGSKSGMTGLTSPILGISNLIGKLSKIKKKLRQFSCHHRNWLFFVAPMNRKLPLKFLTIAERSVRKFSHYFEAQKLQKYTLSFNIVFLWVTKTSAKRLWFAKRGESGLEFMSHCLLSADISISIA